MAIINTYLNEDADDNIDELHCDQKLRKSSYEISISTAQFFSRLKYEASNISKCTAACPFSEPFFRVCVLARRIINLVLLLSSMTVLLNFTLT